LRYVATRPATAIRARMFSSSQSSGKTGSMAVITQITAYHATSA
jgi:hypothetical protein